ncbi:MAG TPA: hypothetical protein VFS21_27640, partial [Roseiflexaceae bacterium]|nr:hypothetical protein [Roseiflexaceae bacterium]HEU4326944.1 hypothetical protein [Roseiflexaceae bacterium]
GTKMDELATNLATLGRPFALVAVTLALLSYIFEPALPEIARDNKGVIRRVLFACIALGLVPDLVGFVLA